MVSCTHPTLSQSYTTVSLTDLTAGDKLTRKFRRASILLMIYRVPAQQPLGTVAVGVILAIKSFVYITGGSKKGAR